MRYALTAGAALAIVLVVPAQAAEPDCSNPITQSAMTQCAGEDFQKADATLNNTYKALMAKLTDSKRKAQLRTAERAWIAYRDAECDFQAMAVEGGTMEPMVRTSCLTSLTETRTSLLKQAMK